ncbi:MAG: LOG family protein [Myxococcales bacterium]|nr:LOG family protein [Myxococcales bacterium]MCB9671941.1 LOG family protein [Alphaproteobacteria bacterium]
MSQHPLKAYKNLEFLNSQEARLIRVQCEMVETKSRLAANGVRDTMVFFGSARMRSSEDAAKGLQEAEAAMAAGTEGAEQALERARMQVRTAPYYEAARELARRLTEWSMASPERNYFICSGAGPGIMEAANRGASEVPGGRSVGLGISLPFEAGNNDYVTPELSFEFHYFFTRKYWFLYMAKALVIFPGGFGTMDELFETLTLIQTKKINRKLPIVLYGTDYWDPILNVDVMADFGTISRADLDLMHRSNSVDDAFAYLTGQLEG